MKLERLMKKYYAGRINSVELPEMTGLPVLPPREIATRSTPYFDVVLNCAAHAALALLVAIGIPGFGKESPLSLQITRIAVDASLDKYIESRVKLLSENIIKIRNTR